MEEYYGGFLNMLRLSEKIQCVISETILPESMYVSRINLIVSLFSIQLIEKNQENNTYLYFDCINYKV